MAKLYPPQIEGVIPAFTGTRIRVPFYMNKTVGWNEISGLQLKVKNVSNNLTLFSCESQNYDKNEFEVDFDLTKEQSAKLILGNYYKIQIAYLDRNNEVGYYSTVGVAKYTSYPQVSIQNLTTSQINLHTSKYVGVYSQVNDISEKIYSYEFTIYDKEDNIFATSGKLLHNHENNTEPYSTTDEFKFSKTLEEDEVYYLIYSGETANGLQFSSPKYRIVQLSTIDSLIKAELFATMNQENVYVDLQIIGYPDENGKEKLAVGNYIICRATSEDNFESWKDIVRFGLFGNTPSQYHWKDMTVQHGYTYKYSLQQYNQEYSIYSNRIISNEIVAEFEHSFLYDGKRQLKIKFNPKVSSFKETLLEQKTNTLGGKYPFFFRNGNVAYKEFPISGLISYHSDDEEMFMLNSEMLLDNIEDFTRKSTITPGIYSNYTEYFEDLDIASAYQLNSLYKLREHPNSQENQIANGHFRTTNLVDYNIAAERIFKLKVLEFLNDDQPKLFRSPSEGNYLVRLMNSSLSPNDQLGRMLHTFNTTASEIGDCDYETLTSYNIIKIDEPDMRQMIWKTANIKELRKDNKDTFQLNAKIYSVNFEDMIPGDKVKLLLNEDFQDVEIVIGATGKYYAEFNEPIIGIEIPKKTENGLVTYSYYGKNINIFDRYRNIYMRDIPVKQFIGDHDDIGKYLKDIKHEVIKYYQLNFMKRPVVELEVKDGIYYWQGSELTYKELVDLDELAIYKVDNKYYNSNCFSYNETHDRVVVSNPIGYSTKAKIEYFIKHEGEMIPNGDSVVLDVKNGYNNIISELNGATIISIGSGVYLEASIQYREKEYDIEENNDQLWQLKQIYHACEQELETYIYDAKLNETTSDEYETQVELLKDKRDGAYKDFIDALNLQLKEEGMIE